MSVFISWSGARSQVLAKAMQEWLPKLVGELAGEIEVFHSDDISKGQNWHSALIEKLQKCRVGVFCITPESLRSQWMLFEAGVLSRHDKQSRLFAYLYGTDQLSGPLSHLQTTRFNRDDSLKFAEDFADAICVDDQDLVIANFNSTWDQFEKEVLYGMLLPVQKLIPDLPGFFENKKTFHESFPRCSNKLWEDRLRRVVRTHSRLSQNDIAEVLSSDPHLGNVYSDLLWALDTFNMHIAAHLMEKLDFKTLGSDKKKMLEDAREQIVNIVSKLQQITRRPVFPLSIHFESERATGKRKSQIQKMEVLLDRKEIQKEELLEARDSLSWALDRIVFYIAVDKDHLADIAFGELVTCLKREEEIARTRNLIKGLQPLYYIAECIDNKMIKNIETSLKYRLLKIIDDVDQFLKDDENRDSGGHIKRRITSIRKKLE